MFNQLNILKVSLVAFVMVLFVPFTVASESLNSQRTESQTDKVEEQKTSDELKEARRDMRIERWLNLGVVPGMRSKARL